VKYPYIGKFLKPLIETPIKGFASWAYCIVEEDCGDNLHCSIPAPILLHGNTIFNTGNFVIPVEEVVFVEEIDCTGKECGHAYTILIDTVVPKIVELQKNQWKKDVYKLFKLSEQFTDDLT